MSTLPRYLLLSLLPVAGLFAQPAGTVPAAPTNPLVAPGPAPVSSGRLTPISFATDTQDAEYVRRAGSQAIEDWVAAFFGRPAGAPAAPGAAAGAKRLAVLPLGRDIEGGYFTDQVRNLFSARAAGTGYSLFTRDDETWKALLAEVRKGDQFGDTMDPGTIQKFGRIQGVQGVIVGRVSGIYAMAGEVGGGAVQLAGEKRGIQVRVLLQAYAVETGEMLWGAERIGVAMLPEDTLVIPGTKRQWIVYGALGFAGLLVLLFLLRMVRSANRPR